MATARSAEREMEAIPDVVIQIMDKKFHAHRSILSKHSEVFKNLAGLLKDDIKLHLRLNEKIDPTAFERLLQWMYSHESMIEKDLLLPSFYAAKELGMSEIKTILRKQLQPLFGIKKHRSILSNSKSETPSQAVDGYDNLTMEDILWLLYSDCVPFQSEKEVFDVMCNWLNRDWERRKTFAGPLTQSVRFALMSNDDLHNIFCKHHQPKHTDRILQMPEAQSWVIKNLIHRQQMSGNNPSPTPSKCFLLKPRVYNVNHVGESAVPSPAKSDADPPETALQFATVSRSVSGTWTMTADSDSMLASLGSCKCRHRQTDSGSGEAPPTTTPVSSTDAVHRSENRANESVVSCSSFETASPSFTVSFSKIQDIDCSFREVSVSDTTKPSGSEAISEQSGYGRPTSAETIPEECTCEKEMEERNGSVAKPDKNKQNGNVNSQDRNEQNGSETNQKRTNKQSGWVIHQENTDQRHRQHACLKEMASKTELPVPEMAARISDSAAANMGDGNSGQKTAKPTDPKDAKNVIESRAKPDRPKQNDDAATSISEASERDKRTTEKLMPTIMCIGGACRPGKSQHGDKDGSRILQVPLMSNGQWEQLPDTPFLRCDAAAVHTDQGRVYLTGGRNPHTDMLPTRSVHCLTSMTNQWSSLANMNDRRMYHSLVYVQENVYAIGGVDEEQRVLSSMERYDVNKNVWEMKPPLLCGVMEAAVTLHDNRIWVCGGFEEVHPNLELTNCIQVYDIQRNEWTLMPPLPQARAMAQLVVIRNNLYLVGGLIQEPGGIAQPTSTIQIYDRDSRSWRKQYNLPSPQCVSYAAFIEPYLYVVGSRQHLTEDTETNIQRLNVDTGEWTEPFPCCSTNSTGVAYSLGITPQKQTAKSAPFSVVVRVPQWLRSMTTIVK